MKTQLLYASYKLQKNLSGTLSIEVNVLPFIRKLTSHWYLNFSGVCGTRKRHSQAHLPCYGQEELTESYFEHGFDYRTICIILKKLYGIVINLQTLKRRLAEY